jgi:hypothetical protein
MALYQTGIGYVTRSGEVRGSFTLQVDTEAVDDVLASVTTQGPIRGISFASQEDPKTELQDRGLSFGTREVFRKLCETKLRGQQVMVITDANARIVGTVLGLDTEDKITPDGRGKEQVDYLVLRTPGAVQGTPFSLRRIPFSTLQSVSPYDDGDLDGDLDFYVQMSRTGNRTRPLLFQVAQGEEVSKVEVSYLVPAPVWRIKYDLSIQGDTAVLTPWAVVQNPLKEALQGIRLTLTTGKPVSFRSGFDHSVKTQRAQVATDLEMSAPMPFEALKSSSFRKEAPVALAAAARGHEAMSFVDESSSPFESSSGVQETQTQAEVEASGEESEYVTTADLPPSGAVTLPLTRRSLSAEVRRVWRPEMGVSPEVAVRMTNAKDLVLERGPVSLRMGGKFVGQALLPYTPKGADFYLPYAKDQALKVKFVTNYGTTRTTKVSLGERFREGSLLMDQAYVHDLGFEVRTLHDQPVDLILEVPRQDGFSLQVPPSDAPYTLRTETATHWRILATVNPGSEPLKFTLRAEKPAQVVTQIQGISEDLFLSWVNAGVISATLRASIEQVMAAQREVVRVTSILSGTRDTLRQRETREGELVTRLKDLGSEAPSVKARFTHDLEVIGEEISALRKVEPEQVEAVQVKKAELARAISALYASVGNHNPQVTAQA